jgi:hypothetical protein
MLTFTVSQGKSGSWRLVCGKLREGSDARPAINSPAYRPNDERVGVYFGLYHVSGYVYLGVSMRSKQRQPLMG